jgi:hypothetical protein
MAEVAVICIAEQPVQGNWTEEQKRAANLAAFLVLQVKSMADDLEASFDDAFDATRVERKRNEAAR